MVVRDYLQAKADERNKVTDRKRAVSTLTEIKSLNQTKNAECEAYLSDLRARHRQDMIEKYDTTIKNQIARQERHEEKDLKMKEYIIVSACFMPNSINWFLLGKQNSKDYQRPDLLHPSDETETRGSQAARLR